MKPPINTLKQISGYVRISQPVAKIINTTILDTINANIHNNVVLTFRFILFPPIRYNLTHCMQQ